MAPQRTPQQLLSHPDAGLGEVAYSAYVIQVGGVSPVTGDNLPPYGVLDDKVKAGWVAAAFAINAALLKEIG
jgi:hypothetical protein